MTPPTGFVTQRPLCSPTPSEGSWETNNVEDDVPSPLNMKPFTAPTPLVNVHQQQAPQQEAPAQQAAPPTELPHYPLTNPPSYSSLISPPPVPAQRSLR